MVVLKNFYLSIIAISIKAFLRGIFFFVTEMLLRQRQRMIYSKVLCSTS